MAKETQYGIIAKSILFYSNPVTRRREAEKIMIHALKYILAPELRNWKMPIVLSNNNNHYNYYMVLKGMFDNINNGQFVNIFSDPNSTIPIAVKAMVTRPRRKNIKKAKKQVSRVYRDFKRARRDGLFGNVDKSYDSAIKSICNATKEAYIITRKKIDPVVYNSINPVEKVVLTTGVCFLNTLYVEQENTYSKGPEKVFSLEQKYMFEDARAIQYMLSPYSYEYYYKGR